MKKIIIISVYIIVLISLIRLEYKIFLNNTAYYINLYDIFGNYKYHIANDSIMHELIELNKNPRADITQIRINDSSPYGYLLTYTFSNRETFSIWLENNPSKYIDYIKDNGHDGVKIYNRYFKIFLYIIIILLVLPIFLLSFYSIFKFL